VSIVTDYESRLTPHIFEWYMLYYECITLGNTFVVCHCFKLSTGCNVTLKAQALPTSFSGLAREKNTCKRRDRVHTLVFEADIFSLSVFMCVNPFHSLFH
jgi:hypothetical protein